jgi:hypothetical protein
MPLQSPSLLGLETQRFEGFGFRRQQQGAAIVSLGWIWFPSDPQESFTW